MARDSYKLSENNNKKLQNLQRRYNRAVERLADKVDADFAPEKMTMKELKGFINSYDDYRTVTSFLNAALKPNAAKISPTYQTPQFFIQQTKNMVTLANRQNKYRAAETRKILEDSGQDVSDNEMGDSELSQYRKRELKKGRSPKEYIKFRKSLTHQASAQYDDWRNQIYKDNYITALQNPRHLDIEYAREIYTLVNPISATMFYDLSVSQHFASFEYLYSPISNREQKAQNIKSTWQELTAKNG